jgi:hypothetical protein
MLRVTGARIPPLHKAVAVEDYYYYYYYYYY